MFLLICSSFCLAQDYQVTVYPEVAWQGKVISVSIMPNQGIKRISGLFLDQKFKLYESGAEWKGIVGVPIHQKPGHYKLKLFITLENGRKKQIIKQLKVWSTKFPFSKFWLKPSKNRLRSKKIVANDWVQIEPHLKKESQDQLWSGRFIWPIMAKVSQGFGHRQIINGKGGGNHRGIDIAAFNGTKIVAPNHGKVVFAKRLKAFGGTMVIDHGQGIYTLYFHLSKMLKPAGSVVEQGEEIALSGDSGISSGPHLHWGLSVHNLRVDPKQWINYEI